MHRTAVVMLIGRGAQLIEYLPNRMADHFVATATEQHFTAVVHERESPVGIEGKARLAHPLDDFGQLAVGGVQLRFLLTQGRFHSAEIGNVAAINTQPLGFGNVGHRLGIGTFVHHSTRDAQPRLSSIEDFSNSASPASNGWRALGFANRETVPRRMDLRSGVCPPPNPIPQWDSDCVPEMTQATTLGVSPFPLVMSRAMVAAPVTLPLPS
jgi:hypothetical protein